MRAPKLSPTDESFQRFKTLTKRVMSVPKKEIDKREAKFRKDKSGKRPKFQFES